jgi:type III secretion protein V
MERSLEDLLRQSIKHTSMGSHLALPDRTRRRLLDLIRLHWKRSQSAAVEPVVLTSLDIRRYVRQLLIRNDLYVPVLAHSEVARDFTVQPVTTLRLSNPTPAEVAAGGAPAHAMQAA